MVHAVQKKKKENRFVKEKTSICKRKNKKIFSKNKTKCVFWCFHYKNFRFKTYPKDVMSLSDAERSESYAIENS